MVIAVQKAGAPTLPDHHHLCLINVISLLLLSSSSSSSFLQYVSFVFQVYRCTKDLLSFSSLIPLTLAAPVLEKMPGRFWDKHWVIITIYILQYHINVLFEQHVIISCFFSFTVFIIISIRLFFHLFTFCYISIYLHL